MNKRCCFAGHSKVYEDYDEKLKQNIESLILNKGVTEFYISPYNTIYFIKNWCQKWCQKNLI